MLIMPNQLAGRRIEGDRTVSIERRRLFRRLRAWPKERGHMVSLTDAKICQIGVRVVAAGDPDGPAVPIRRRRAAPAVTTDFRLPGQRVEAPDLLTGCRIESYDEAAAREA